MPKCLYCRQETTNPKFCNNSHSALYNNTRRVRKERVSYEANPKICPNCGGVVPFEKKRNKYCGPVCVKATEAERSRRNIEKSPMGSARKGTGRSNGPCLECGKDRGRNKKYCSQRCAYAGLRRFSMQRIKNAGFVRDTNRPAGKRYLVKVRGHRCEICGLTEWQGQPCPLILDHIDGDYKNGYLENLRLVCPNCDARLPTFKSKNKGRGRPRK